jgi:hypothetical protein
LRDGSELRVGKWTLWDEHGVARVERYPCAPYRHWIDALDEKPECEDDRPPAP